MHREVFFCRLEMAKSLSCEIFIFLNLLIFHHSYFWTKRISWFQCLESNIFFIST